MTLSAADPLNPGVILPGPRVAAVPSNLVVFRDGMVVRTVTGRDTNDRRGVASPEVARRDTAPLIKSARPELRAPGSAPAQHAFGRAPAQEVQHAVLSFRRHHDQIHIELSPGRQNPLHGVVFPNSWFQDQWASPGTKAVVSGSFPCVNERGERDR